jgi:hypothetical protein
MDLDGRPSPRGSSDRQTIIGLCAKRKEGSGGSQAVRHQYPGGIEGGEYLAGNIFFCSARRKNNFLLLQSPGGKRDTTDNLVKDSAAS